MLFQLESPSDQKVNEINNRKNSCFSRHRLLCNVIVEKQQEVIIKESVKSHGVPFRSQRKSSLWCLLKMPHHYKQTKCLLVFYAYRRDDFLCNVVETSRQSCLFRSTKVTKGYRRSHDSPANMCLSTQSRLCNTRLTTVNIVNYASKLPRLPFRHRTLV